MSGHLPVFICMAGEAARSEDRRAGQLQRLAVGVSDIAVGAAADHAVLHKLHKAPPLSP